MEAEKTEAEIQATLAATQLVQELAGLRTKTLILELLHQKLSRLPQVDMDLFYRGFDLCHKLRRNIETIDAISLREVFSSISEDELLLTPEGIYRVIFDVRSGHKYSNVGARREIAPAEYLTHAPRAIEQIHYWTDQLNNATEAAATAR